LDRVVSRGKAIGQVLADVHEASSPGSETDAERINGEVDR
jgi:hypothetical protein